MRIAISLLLLPRLALAADPVRATVYVSNEQAMDERQLMLFEHSLLAELGKRDGVQPVTRPAAAEPTEPEQCPERRTSCLTRLAEGLGADEVVAVHAVTMAGARVLTVKRLHIQSAEIVASVTRQMTASSGEAYLMILGDVVEELYRDRPVVGDAGAGVPFAVIERWDPPPLRPWTVWTGVGLTAAAAATGITFGVMSKSAEDEFNQLANSGEPVDGAELTRVQDLAESRATTANVFYATAGVLAVGSFLAWWFADWGSDEAALLELAAGGTTLTLTF